MPALLRDMWQTRANRLGNYRRKTSPEDFAGRLRRKTSPEDFAGRLRRKTSPEGQNKFSEMFITKARHRMSERGLARTGRSLSTNDLRERANAGQNLSGSVLIRASLHSSKVMSVQFVAKEDGLKINLLQLINGQVQVFKLARLSYRNLAACWAWERNDIFVIAAVEDATSLRLFHEIYCWPQDISRNDWLAFFESKSVRSMTVHEAALLGSRGLRQRRISLSSTLAPVHEDM
jgi:hypothetical protein